MTSMNETDEQILKVDGRGRVRTPPERRDAILDEFECSGLSGMRFAAQHNINYQTFASWVKKRRDNRKQHAAPNSGTDREFAEVVIQGRLDCTANQAINIRLPGGACLEVSHPEQLNLAANLLLKLKQASPC